jgi:DNA-binding transcriptional LysR family regulator
MDLRVVRYFLAVVDAGSVSAAAKTLLVAQPSLSRQLQRLEADLGQRLFDRSKKRLILSAFGRAFLPIARDLVRHAELATASVRALASGTTATLTVAAPPATTIDILAPFIARSGPTGVIDDAVQLPPERVYGALLTGTADIALGTRIVPEGFQWRIIGHTHPWAQFAPGYGPLTDSDRIAVTDLLDWPLIMMTKEHAIRRLFDDAVAHAGRAYQPAFETSSNSVAQALAAAGRGVCVLSDHSRFGVRAIPVTSSTGELRIPLYAAWDPRHFAADAIERTLDELSLFIEELYRLEPAP